MLGKTVVFLLLLLYAFFLFLYSNDFEGILIRPSKAVLLLFCVGLNGVAVVVDADAVDGVVVDQLSEGVNKKNILSADMSAKLCPPPLVK